MGRLVALKGLFRASRNEAFLSSKLYGGGAKDFIWEPEQVVAFESLKSYLSEFTTLMSLDPTSTLLLYAEASYGSISVALIQEKPKDEKL